MKQKTARRWLRKSQWKIAKSKLLGWKKSVERQYIKCLCYAQQDVRFRRF
uniref:Uncharacterized protein n=1 Tax=viral metagenome TaxID=1070528 RepID=A0A6M3JFK4_9ZZZZ